ncbi:MAG: dephospho-CoA kinase [Pseudomonadota bacterium]|nr:dephospho-CoA kinase [Pseudomonadota bacterium]
MALTIGLTGGIGSGKSTVAEIFAELGVPTIDTDVIAREVVQPGTPALKDIATHFGLTILLADGHLNRQALAEKVFQNPKEKAWLEALLHPRILEQVERAKSTLHYPYCIVVIPLLIEAVAQSSVDRILLIDTPEALQVQRILKRDPQRTSAEIEAIIHSQASRATRLKAADDVILNTTTHAELRKQVLAMHEMYLRLSANNAV